MSTSAIQKSDGFTAIANVLINGDLSQLNAQQRIDYYNNMCVSLGLNPLTRPLEFLKLSGKTVLYARKDCTDQLRTIRGISVYQVDKERIEDVYAVTAYVKNAEGRTDSAVGAVPIGNLKGESLANALMKAETKAKRRATLSICGLGVLDETELETIAGAVPASAVAPDGLVGPKCEDCGNAYSDWKGEIDSGRKISYNITQLQVISRKLYEKDICGDCLLKRKTKRLSAAEAGQPDPMLAPSSSMETAEPERKGRGRKQTLTTSTHQVEETTVTAPSRKSKATDFDPAEFEITDKEIAAETECISPQISFK